MPKTFDDFQLQGKNLTDKEINRLKKLVIAEYKAAIVAINEQVKNAYTLLADVPKEDYYNALIKYNRLTNLLEQIKSQYSAYSRAAGRKIENAVSLSFHNTYYRSTYTSQWGPEYTIGMIPDELAELAVYGTESAWKAILKKKIDETFGSPGFYKSKAGTLMSLLLKNRNSEIKKIQSAITSGLLQGLSYTDMARNISNVIGTQTGTSVTGAMANSLRIVRTETARTANAATYAQQKYMESVGMDIKRKLVAVLDNRTRSQSASMDGQTVGVDEGFLYPNGKRYMVPGSTGIPAYDVNDREIVVSVINGIGPDMRIGRNPKTGENEYFEWKSFPEWAKENGLKKNVHGEYY